MLKESQFELNFHNLTKDFNALTPRELSLV